LSSSAISIVDEPLLTSRSDSMRVCLIICIIDFFSSIQSSRVVLWNHRRLPLRMFGGKPTMDPITCYAYLPICIPCHSTRMSNIVHCDHVSAISVLKTKLVLYIPILSSLVLGAIRTKRRTVLSRVKYHLTRKECAVIIARYV
jgi:hypothetical protein